MKKREEGRLDDDSQPGHVARPDDLHEISAPQHLFRRSLNDPTHKNQKHGTQCPSPTVCPSEGAWPTTWPVRTRTATMSEYVAAPIAIPRKEHEARASQLKPQGPEWPLFIESQPQVQQQNHSPEWQNQGTCQSQWGRFADRQEHQGDTSG